MKKIVITGGPGGGKTTSLDLFRREIKDNVFIVPEAATILFENGLERGQDLEGIKRIQLSIYQLQICLESIYAPPKNGFCQICDRGTLDSLAYWPGAENTFLDAANTSLEEEFNRYDAVIFFETGASGGSDIKSNNPQRIESTQEAITLDKNLQEVWSRHPNYHFISSNISFIDKVVDGLHTIRDVMNS
jgi:predicted ATPase